MAILPIVRYPHPVLRTRARPINKMTAAIRRLIDDLAETMYASPGTIGLAAPQVGQALRLIVVDVSRKEQGHGLVVLINPLIKASGDRRIVREGCLSLPDYTANVGRAQRVFVTGVNPSGHTLRFQVEGIEAVCFQHEVDHLDGLLFLDRVESLKTDIFRRKRYL